MDRGLQKCFNGSTGDDHTRSPTPLFTKEDAVWGPFGKETAQAKVNYSNLWHFRTGLNLYILLLGVPVKNVPFKVFWCINQLFYYDLWWTKDKLKLTVDVHCSDEHTRTHTWAAHFSCSFSRHSPLTWQYTFRSSYGTGLSPVLAPGAGHTSPRV